MNLLSIQIIGYIVVFGSFIIGLAAIVAYLQYQTDLQHFRANLRPGDSVRVKTSEGFINARIMKRSNGIFFTMETDSRRPLHTTIKNIYP